MVVRDDDDAVLSSSVEELVQAAHGEVLVDEEQLALLVAPADQLDKVPVRQLADRVHLRHKLLLSPVGVGLLVHRHPLDGHLQVHPIHVSKVNGAKASSAELAGRTEVGSRTPELSELKFDRTMCVDHLLQVAAGESSPPRQPSPHEQPSKQTYRKHKQCNESQKHLSPMPFSNFDIIVYRGEVPGLYLVQLCGVARGTCESQIYVIVQNL